VSGGMLRPMETTAAKLSRARIQRDPPTADREHRRQMALRHVRQYPDPVLRRPASDVTKFDDELAALVDRMYGIMNDAYGVGLAAPQVGLLLRVFTYQVDEDTEPAAVINPKITWSSDETDVEEEGCLSLGDVRVPIERPVAIKVSGKTLTGEDLELEVDGFTARVFQHEIDHLDGVLAIDRVKDDAARKEAMRTLRPRP
jgi:peptide deformylase